MEEEQKSRCRRGRGEGGQTKRSEMSNAYFAEQPEP